MAREFAGSGRRVALRCATAATPRAATEDTNEERETESAGRLCVCASLTMADDECVGSRTHAQTNARTGPSRGESQTHTRTIASGRTFLQRERALCQP